MWIHGSEINKADIRFGLRELDALDYCRMMGWAASDEEIAENTGLSGPEVTAFVEKCDRGELINIEPPAEGAPYLSGFCPRCGAPLLIAVPLDFDDYDTANITEG